jgi:hypothetical protein
VSGNPIKLFLDQAVCTSYRIINEYVASMHRKTVLLQYIFRFDQAQLNRMALPSDTKTFPRIPHLHK